MAVSFIPSSARAVNQASTAIAVDTATLGNSRTTVGPPDHCRSAAAGDRFPVDIVIVAGSEIEGFQVRVRFNPAVVQIDDASADFFLGSGGISAGDTSFPITNGSWLYAYTNQPAVSGSGVLVRLTLRALSDGTSDISLPVGPLDTALVDSNQAYVPLSDVGEAEIRVGSSCEGSTPDATGTTSTPPPSEGAKASQPSASDGGNPDPVAAASNTGGTPLNAGKEQAQASLTPSLGPLAAANAAAAAQESKVSTMLIVGLTVGPLLMLGIVTSGYITARRRRRASPQGQGK